MAERDGHEVSQHFRAMVNRFHSDDIDGMRARFPRDRSDQSHPISHSNSYYVRVFAGECDQVLVELDDLFAALEKSAGDDYVRSIVGDVDVVANDDYE